MASVTINEGEVRALTERMVATYWAVECRGPIKQILQAQCPVDHGLLQQQHQVDKPVRTGPGSWRIRFRAIPYYGVYVHEGRREVRPVHARVLRWHAKGGGIVFSMRSKAVRANPWLYRGLLIAGLKNVRRVRR